MNFQQVATTVGNYRQIIIKCTLTITLLIPFTLESTVATSVLKSPALEAEGITPPATHKPRTEHHQSTQIWVRPMAERVFLPGNRSNHNQTQTDRSIATLTAEASPQPGDPHSALQWSFLDPAHYIGASGIFAAHAHSSGNSPVIVAVVDSGLMLGHEDLDVLPGYDFISESQVANDGNGRDSDPTDPGDWVTKSEITDGLISTGCLVAHSKWHGTAVSGVIGAISDNQKGIVGGAPSVLLLPVRVTGKCGGYVDDLIDGIRWAAGLPVDGVPMNNTPARVINLSVGFPGSCSVALQNAIDDAIGAGAILAVAATNSAASLDQQPQSPASCKNVLTVGALLRNGNLAPYSAFGSAVSVLAPGGSANDGIITTENSSDTSPAAQSSYGYHFGTSMATAHLTAALATLLHIDPSLSNDVLQQLVLRSTATAETITGCFAGSCGAGRLNVERAVDLLLNPPADDWPSVDAPIASTISGTVTQPQTAAASNIQPIDGEAREGSGIFEISGLLLLLGAARLNRRNDSRQIIADRT